MTTAAQTTLDSWARAAGIDRGELVAAILPRLQATMPDSTVRTVGQLANDIADDIIRAASTRRTNRCDEW